MITKPIIFFCISTATGCLCALLLKYSIILDAAVAASFLLCIFMIGEKKYILLIIFFFIIGFINFEIYFNINLSSDTAYKIRIISKNSYYSVGEYNGRKLNLEGRLNGVRQGDIISVTGKFKSEQDFSYGIVGSFKISEIINKRGDFITELYNFRSMLYNRFYWQIGEANAGKVMAIAFGDTSHLQPEDKEDFKKLGIVHAVSVSGLHMLVLYKVISLFLNLEISFAVCTLYAVFTGFQAATLRSLLMLIIFKLSKRFNKNYDFFSCISLAALILLIFKPYYIVDIGFMLSFLSTLGMCLFSAKLSKVLYILPQKINEALSVSISAQSFSMPYALFTIKNFSFGFLPGNIFIVPIFSAVVIFGNLSLILLPVRNLFNLTAWFISVLLNAADFMCKLLLKITPPLIYVTVFNSILIFTLYICYIFIKKGYKKVVYIPFVMLLFLFIQYYSFFPVFSYVKLQNGDGYIIRNKFTAVLVSNYTINGETEKYELMGKLNINKINSCENSDVEVSINKKYTVYISQKGKNVKINKIGTITPIFSLENKTAEYESVKSNKTYDIIKIGDYKNLKKADLPKKCLDFDIVMDKIIAVK